MRKFLLIDDHYIVRSGMARLLSNLYPFSQIHEAEDEKTAVEKLEKHKYDVVFMDINIPNADMLRFMEMVHGRFPKLKVLMFSVTEEHIYAKRFLKAGAKGFLPKSSSLPIIQKAIDAVLNDNKYISNSLAESLLCDSVSGVPVNPFNKLSRREFEIVSLMLAGRSIGEIGKLINLGTSTVGTYKTRMFKKLGITNLLELRALATLYKL